MTEPIKSALTVEEARRDFNTWELAYCYRTGTKPSAREGWQASRRRTLEEVITKIRATGTRKIAARIADELEAELNSKETGQ